MRVCEQDRQKVKLIGGKACLMRNINQVPDTVSAILASVVRQYQHELLIDGSLRVLMRQFRTTIESSGQDMVMARRVF